MRLRLKSLYQSLLGVEPQERLKLFLLSATYFCIIAGYTLNKELKDSIFVAIVGKEYIPTAKILSMIVLIPAILLYSVLVDRVRRYQLLCFYNLFYGLVGLVFAFLLGHPTIGIGNTDTSPFRLFGWIFYFFVEGYTPFIISVFWAFANSISDRNAAKKNYGLMISGSKLGGMLSAGLAWVLLNWHGSANGLLWSDTTNHQIIVVASSLFSLTIPFVILLLMKKVPGRYLHGYEVVYRLEKEREKAGEAKTGMFSGLFMMIKYPYVLGIFCMIFFYEVINTILSYQRVGIAQANSATISQVSGFLFQIVFFIHFFGFLISLFGTRVLLDKLGEKRVLVLIPIVSGILLVYSMISYTWFALIGTFIALKSINYALNYPVRETLYIPTIKEMKFKSKSWIDAFGSKFAKSTGSVFNGFVGYMGPAFFFPAHIFFFIFLSGTWVVASLLLGRRYEQAINRNEAIGADFR